MYEDTTRQWIFENVFDYMISEDNMFLITVYAFSIGGKMIFMTV